MDMLFRLTEVLRQKADLILSDERSRRLFVNVLGSMFVKIFSMVVTLSLVPVSLKYTDKESYGAWLTLSSMITWFYLFDFGLSNGLTNKLTEALALNKIEKVRKYVSTSYAFLISIIAIANVLFYIFHPYIDWNLVFNTQIEKSELANAIHVTFLSFSVTFILKPLNDLLKAHQKHFLLSINQVLGNLLALVLIVFLGDYFEQKFLFLAIALGVSYPFILILSSIIFYASIFKKYIPTVSWVEIGQLKEVFGLSGKFFIIQLSLIAILTSNNFLISFFVDNQHVTYFNIALRLFSIISIFQILIMTPLWPAFTDAYTLKDFAWISSIIKKCNKLNLLLLIPLLLILIFCNQIYALWIGTEIEIPFEVSLLVFLFVGVSLFKETYVSFINGVGKLNLQTLYSIVTLVLQIPFAYLLTRVFDFGISGILFLNIFWVAIAFILWQKQYKIVMQNKYSGRIWE
jgi:O-antigen/teichoic acid export membrane protein